MRPRPSTAGWRRSRRCSRSARCANPVPQPSAPGSSRPDARWRGTDRSAGARGQAEASLEAAGPRAAAPAAWPVPRGVVGASGQLPDVARSGDRRAHAAVRAALGRGARAAVTDVDIARRWVRVGGKGGKERSVPIDTDVAGAIQTYLLAERPETDSTSLFVVAKGRRRGQPLTPAGLRTVFRYHRERSMSSRPPRRR